MLGSVRDDVRGRLDRVEKSVTEASDSVKRMALVVVGVAVAFLLLALGMAGRK